MKIAKGLKQTLVALHNLMKVTCIFPCLNKQNSYIFLPIYKYVMIYSIKHSSKIK